MAKAKKAVNDNTPTIFGRFRKWLEFSGGVSALNRLDDRTLADIGLTRSEISDYVRDWSAKTIMLPKLILAPNFLPSVLRASINFRIAL